MLFKVDNDFCLSNFGIAQGYIHVLVGLATVHSLSLSLFLNDIMLISIFHYYNPASKKRWVYCFTLVRLFVRLSIHNKNFSRRFSKKVKHVKA